MSANTPKNWKKLLLRWGAALVIGVLIAWLSARARGMKADISPALYARYWSDGCFVSALVIGGVGALTWVSSTGFLDIFSYGFSSLLTLFTSLRKPKDQVSYFDYKTYRAEKRKPARCEWLIVGLLFLAASVILLQIYYRIGA